MRNSSWEICPTNSFKSAKNSFFPHSHACISEDVFHKWRTTFQSSNQLNKEISAPFAESIDFLTFCVFILHLFNDSIYVHMVLMPNRLGLLYCVTFLKLHFAMWMQNEFSHDAIRLNNGFPMEAAKRKNNGGLCATRYELKESKLHAWCRCMWKKGSKMFRTYLKK